MSIVLNPAPATPQDPLPQASGANPDMVIDAADNGSQEVVIVPTQPQDAPEAPYTLDPVGKITPIDGLSTAQLVQATADLFAEPATMAVRGVFMAEWCDIYGVTAPSSAASATSSPPTAAEVRVPHAAPSTPAVHWSDNVENFALDPTTPTPHARQHHVDIPHPSRGILETTAMTRAPTLAREPLIETLREASSATVVT
ncbi:predicted protein [Postia placenta Mad-698-R]|nr:predicted protein [Postia placenta Mad-698-R]